MNSTGRTEPSEYDTGGLDEPAELLGDDVDSIWEHDYYDCDEDFVTDAYS